MKEYIVVYERAENNWSAYSPDVPGCMATGKTRDEVEQNFREALALHIEGLKAEGLPVPEPVSETGRVSITAQCAGHRNETVDAKQRNQNQIPEVF